MTLPLGLGEYHVGDWRDDAGDWIVVGEATFEAREHFVDALRDELPNAYAKFCESVRPTVREVFDANGDRETLKALLKNSGFTWDWPPSSDAEWPPYGEGFVGWPPPTPPGTLERPLKEFIRITKIGRAW